MRKVWKVVLLVLLLTASVFSIILSISVIKHTVDNLPNDYLFFTLRTDYSIFNVFRYGMNSPFIAYDVKVIVVCFVFLLLLFGVLITSVYKNCPKIKECIFILKKTLSEHRKSSIANKRKKKKDRLQEQLNKLESDE